MPRAPPVTISGTWQMTVFKNPMIGIMGGGAPPMNNCDNSSIHRTAFCRISSASIVSAPDCILAESPALGRGKDMEGPCMVTSEWSQDECNWFIYFIYTRGGRSRRRRTTTTAAAATATAAATRRRNKNKTNEEEWQNKNTKTQVLRYCLCKSMRHSVLFSIFWAKTWHQVLGKGMWRCLSIVFRCVSQYVPPTMVGKWWFI